MQRFLVLKSPLYNFLQVFHKIITTGHQRLQPLFDCLLTIIVNGKPYYCLLTIIVNGKPYYCLLTIIVNGKPYYCLLTIIVNGKPYYCLLTIIVNGKPYYCLLTIIVNGKPYYCLLTIIVNGKPYYCLLTIIVNGKPYFNFRAASRANQHFAYAKTKAQISYTVHFFYFLNPKFPASSHLLCLYSLVCVRPVRKPNCLFSHDTHLYAGFRVGNF